MEIILLIILILSAVIFLIIGAAVLNGVTKLFKVQNTSFKKALLIIILGQLISGLIGLLFAVLITLLGVPEAPYLIEGIGLVAGILVFHLLLNKFYNSSFAKNLGIYIIYSILAVIIAIAFIIPIRIFIAEPFWIKGAAMEPHLSEQDYTIIQKFDKSYDRGDIVVFRYPKDPSQYFIKRIIGLPGETIEIKDDNVYLYNQDFPNGVMLDESDYLPEGTSTPALSEEPVKAQLAEDQYYLLGDNRQQSLDSRKFGPVNKDLFVGKYWITLKY